jgi:NAD(P)-dependent dehydrogenase (short-subunit alcohol dehydrogenase family)
MTQPICIVSGVGPGTGSALARRFASGGYRVAMLARDAERLARLEREVPGTKAYPCDVSDTAQVEATADRIERDLGLPDALVHNAVGGAFGSFLEIDPAVLNRNFQVNTMGLLHLARRIGRFKPRTCCRSVWRFRPARSWCASSSSSTIAYWTSPAIGTTPDLEKISRRCAKSPRRAPFVM